MIEKSAQNYLTSQNDHGPTSYYKGFGYHNPGYHSFVHIYRVCHIQKEMLSPLSNMGQITDQFYEGLREFVPSQALPILKEQLLAFPVQLKISRPRKTKLGDYRPPWKKPHHEISVNCDLNSYAFTVTLVHEIAHMYTWEKYKNTVNPHGQEWKSTFRMLLIPYLNARVFPEQVERAIATYLKNPKASSCTDRLLYKSLSQFDATPQVHLDDLGEGAKFKFKGKAFKNLGVIRTRHRCYELASGRIFLISGAATVQILE